MLAPCIVVDGAVVGVWSRAVVKARAAVTIAPFAPLTKSVRAAVDDAGARFGAFLGMPVDVDVGPVRSR